MPEIKDKDYTMLRWALVKVYAILTILFVTLVITTILFSIIAYNSVNNGFAIAGIIINVICYLIAFTINKTQK